MSDNPAVVPSVSVMPLFLTDADVRASFDWRSASEALRRAYTAPYKDAMFPPRSMARSDGLWLRTLSGVSPDGGMMGAKMIAVSLRNHRASYLIPLFDQETTELRALLDASSITGFRTAATSALAADALAPRQPLVVGIIGSGYEAQMHLRALASIRELDSVRVFSPNPASRARFAANVADLGLSLISSDSARAAVDGANLVICAARSRDETPTLYAEWLADNVTVVSIGSTLPEQREVDVSIIAKAALIVTDMPEEVADDTGDMLAARAAGIAFEDRLVSLSDALANRDTVIAGKSGLLLYKSVGAALQDLVIAGMCVDRARQLSLGTVLPVTIAPLIK